MVRSYDGHAGQVSSIQFRPLHAPSAPVPDIHIRAEATETAEGTSPLEVELEAELAQLVRDGTVRSTAELVQHFRQRPKADASLKEQLSAAVKKIAYMDKKSNRLKLKEGF